MHSRSILKSAIALIFNRLITLQTPHQIKNRPILEAKILIGFYKIRFNIINLHVKLIELWPLQN